MAINLLKRSEKGSPLSADDYDNNLTIIETQTQATNEKGAANGYASLGAGGLVPVAQLGSGSPTGSKFLRDDGTFSNLPVAVLSQTLTFVPSGTTTWDTALGNTAIVTLTSSTSSIGAPTNIQAGTAYALVIIQDGTGSRTVTWNAAFKWPSGSAPILSTTAGAIDIISFLSYNGTTLNGVAQKAFS